MLLDFLSYMKNDISENEYSLLEKLRATQFYELKGRPSLSADAILYALHLRYTSLQAYKLLLNKFSLPSILVINKIQERVLML